MYYILKKWIVQKMCVYCISHIQSKMTRGARGTNYMNVTRWHTFILLEVLQSTLNMCPMVEILFCLRVYSKIASVSKCSIKYRNLGLYVCGNLVSWVSLCTNRIVYWYYTCISNKNMFKSYFKQNISTLEVITQQNHKRKHNFISNIPANLFHTH
jgi:hypothetical protein